MSDPIESRRFNREALDQDEDVAMFVRELDVVMASALEPMDPSVELLGRLQATVTQPAHRYAPFIDRVAELFDLSSDDAATQCAKLADPKAWRFAGLPGVYNIAVRGGPKVAGAETVFARFAPGTRFPKHRHGGFERVLVLEGSYTDSAGIAHHAGELRVWAPGTKHAFRVDTAGPCIFASAVVERTFEALPLRLFARILGR